MPEIRKTNGTIQIGDTANCMLTVGNRMRGRGWEVGIEGYQKTDGRGEIEG